MVSECGKICKRCYVYRKKCAVYMGNNAETQRKRNIY